MLSCKQQSPSYVPVQGWLTLMRCCDLPISSRPAQGRWHREAEQHIQPASHKPATCWLVSKQPFGKRIRERGLWPWLITTTSCLCLQGLGLPCHLLCLPVAFPHVWGVWNAALVRGTACCQNCSQLEHWCPSTSGYAAAAQPFPRDLPGIMPLRHGGYSQREEEFVRCRGAELPAKAGGTGTPCSSQAKCGAQPAPRNPGAQCIALMQVVTERSKQGLI